MEMEQRIADLETRLAFQDDTVQALNDVLVEQQKVIERLQAQVEVLARRQAELQSTVGGESEEVPPPHY
ncbi:SlyX family protein [Pseudomonas sp. PS1]|uniref:Protein SlyX homolog n=1 Tax=Stutzerimonas marianensis TaxID=2929513 RepID=A0A9X2AQS8_9GAMM|nr:SlyX family protein [Pseudomonas marianensis]MCJ0972648.1 SlyX family protein [Pseudomonas marianensis]